MKIIHLITDTQIGGAESVLARLVRASDPSRFHHVVISMKSVGPVGKQLQAAGIEVYDLGMRGGRPSLAGLFRLLKLLRLSKPDLLQCWMYHANLLGLVGAKLGGVPRVVWGLRCSDMDFAYMRRLTRWVVSCGARLSSFPDIIIVNSDSGREVHTRLGYDSSQMIVIPNGFDLELFKDDQVTRQSVRRELGVSDERLLIGLIARFHPVKDHRTFFKAAGLLARCRSDVNFLLCGPGVTPENAALGRMVRDNGLEGLVHLLRSRDDVSRLNAALDIATSSSAFGEGFSNSIGEAMACGVPCVVTDVGDAAYLVGDTGRVVAPRDPPALAAACAELIDLGSNQRRALGRRARQRITENFRLDQLIERYESLFESLVPEARQADVLLRDKC